MTTFRSAALSGDRRRLGAAPRWGLANVAWSHVFNVNICFPARPTLSPEASVFDLPLPPTIFYPPVLNPTCHFFGQSPD